MMFKNHIKIVLRNVLKSKGYTLINVAGLAIGIAVCFLILLWVRDELSYDRFHTKADRIYRVLWDARYGDNHWTLPLGPAPVGDVLGTRFPEVESVSQLRHATRVLRQPDESMIEKRFFFVDDGFFDVFDVTFLAGDPQTALESPDAVVVTEETAKRYFPAQDPLRQTLQLSDGTLLQVTGVVKSFPARSHFHFDFLAPLTSLPIFNQRRTQWGSATVYTYLVLEEADQAAVLQAKLAAYLEKEVLIGNSGLEPGNSYRLPLQRLTDIHLQSHYEYELAPNGNIVYVYLFAVIGVFIIVLACINFINLTTARSLRRAREVGVRKVFGSQRAQLIRQFLFESVLYVLLALFLAVALAELALPAFNDIVKKQLTTDYFGSPTAITLLVAITLVVALLAGSYPAFVLSAFRPAQALKGHFTSDRGGVRLRNSLVVVQFCISVGLIVGTLIVRGQLDFVQNKRLGFDKEHVLVVHNAGALGNQHPVFRERLHENEQVVRAAAVQSLPGYNFDSTVFEPEQPASYERSSLTYAMIDEHFVDVLGLKVVKGRNFSTAFGTDSSAFLINQSTAEVLGWQDPIGKQLRSGFIDGPVIGVVEDFHFESLHNEVKPIVLPFIRWQPSYFAVRLQRGNVTDGVAAVRDVWKQLVSHQHFEYSFLDQDYEQLYRGEQRMARVFGVFATLAILIASLGLFGLASFMAEQRTKEIGVRKVLGASVVGVIGLLSKDIVKLVFLATLLAWPIVWVAMNRWLQNFAYRIDLDWTVFLLAGGLALTIALLTVSTQAIRAALANPVDSLRYE